LGLGAPSGPLRQRIPGGLRSALIAAFLLICGYLIGGHKCAREVSRVVIKYDHQIEDVQASWVKHANEHTEAAAVARRADSIGPTTIATISKQLQHQQHSAAPTVPGAPASPPAQLPTRQPPVSQPEPHPPAPGQIAAGGSDKKSEPEPEPGQDTGSAPATDAPAANASCAMPDPDP
jgi:hypothetical protein